ncbi:MAG: fumarylacetoacetate hydrolase family protein [Planctomycetota bacterium]|nr:fumarylacetoacetate hydrolase family protein [Planctomycetota bacterium]
MRLAKVLLSSGERRVAVWEDQSLRLLDLSQVDNCRSLSDILHSPDRKGLANFLIDPQTDPQAEEAVTFLAPIDHQEVWAAGVTYKRSQVARMEESETGASHYDRVYTAPRPEIFFKATPNRVSGPHQPVRVRADSEWSVPEPELTLIASPERKLVGFTIGNDMSARDIEGENPLYLPQAKMYKQACALGPCVLIPDAPLDRPNTKIKLKISRKGKLAFEGETNVGEMVRDFDELLSWLGRENDYSQGVMLLTGTGIVPPDDFTLDNGDIVTIDITGIGSLVNPVVKDKL